MPKPRKKKNYWDDTIEAYAKEFAVCNSPLRQEQLYKKLLPKLRLMTESILSRYITKYNYSEQRYLIQDAIDNGLLELRRSYNPDRAKAYAFLGTCIKHRLYDLTFINDKFPRSKFESKAIKLDDYPEFAESIPDTTDNYYQEEQEAILKRFKTLLQKLIEDNQPKSRHTNPVEYTVKERRIQYMKYAIEYGERFCIDNFINMNSYIQNRMNICDNEIAILSQHFFGTGSTPIRNEKNTAKKDDTLAVPSVLNDDFTPDLSSSQVSIRRKKLRDLNNEIIFW